LAKHPRKEKLRPSSRGGDDRKSRKKKATANCVEAPNIRVGGKENPVLGCGNERAGLLLFACIAAKGGVRGHPLGGEEGVGVPFDGAAGKSTARSDPGRDVPKWNLSFKEREKKKKKKKIPNPSKKEKKEECHAARNVGKEIA